ncbi:hypothetical protein [Terrisporobacter muris]|uniref:Uncharacterized protein n=1 Tax=Terrisporobacter muris TaxID=2963284 RepID=A0A9X2RZZ0_9FIRM|nr:hypothetical protein [Terrisporobacter muris]MCR1821309.1 hypothetical protein [Terrisporobacter muris]
MMREVHESVIEILNKSRLEHGKIDKYYEDIKKDVENLSLMEIYTFNIRDILKPCEAFEGNYDDICGDIVSSILEYQAMENSIMKLVNEGIIYPVGIISNGEYNWKIKIKIHMQIGYYETKEYIDLQVIPYREFKLLRK